MRLLVRFLLTFNATSLLIVIFLFKSLPLDCELAPALQYAVAAVLVVVPWVLTGLSIGIIGKLSVESFDRGRIAELSHASNVFLPSYLGYFFVALSVPNWQTLVFVYVLLFVFTFFSQALYFNPLFLLWKYHFYSIRTEDGVEAFLISRDGFRRPLDVEIARAHRINGFTFLDRGD